MTESPAPARPTPVVFPVTKEHEDWQRQQVVAAALSWEGTPYRQCGFTKGPRGAVDCSMLLVGAFVEAGVYKPFDPRPYSPVWFLHRSEEKYTAWLDTLAKRTNNPRPGDVQVFRFGRCVSHSGIVIDADTIVHAFANERLCVKTNLSAAPALAARSTGYYDMWAMLRGPQ